MNIDISLHTSNAHSSQLSDARRVSESHLDFWLLRLRRRFDFRPRYSIRPRLGENQELRTNKGGTRTISMRYRLNFKEEEVDRPQPLTINPMRHCHLPSDSRNEFAGFKLIRKPLPFRRHPEPSELDHFGRLHFIRPRHPGPNRKLKQGRSDSITYLLQ